MLDQERVHRDPEAGVDPCPQARLGLLRGPALDDAEPVGDPVDVGVDRDRRDPVAEHQHAVRGLRPDAGERHELFERAGHGARVPGEDLPGAGADGPSLRPVEPYGPDEALELPRVRPREARRVREPREQTRAGNVGRLVPRPLGEDRADQHLERVLRVVAQIGSTPIPGPVERGEPVEQCLPVENGGRRGSAHVVSPRRPGVGSGTGVRPGSLRSGSSAASGPRTSSPIR